VQLRHLDKFKLKKPENEEEKRRLLAVYDYVSHSEKRKRIFILAQRRWDVYHALKSTYHGLWIGFTLGIIYRFFYELFISTPLYTIPIQNWVSILSINLEPWLLISLFIIVTLLLYFLRKGAEWTVTEYGAIAEARIRDSKVEPKDLKKAFPDAFPKTSS
jgi:hypothetical protein